MNAHKTMKYTYINRAVVTGEELKTCQQYALQPNEGQSALKLAGIPRLIT